MDNWINENIRGILSVIEVLWVGGVLAVFVIYFYARRRLRQRKRESSGDDGAGRGEP